MLYEIKYTGACLQGLIRRKNEDNICCDKEYLPIIHTDNTSGFEGSFTTGTVKRFAVFDGLGGEKSGEVASHLAARTFSRYEIWPDIGFAEETAQISDLMNQEVKLYARKNHIRNMGSTVTALYFEKEEIRGFNLGDSRCYRWSSGTLQQLSTDHVISDAFRNKSYLTQCIGYPDDSDRPAPSMYSAPYQEKDIYLLCTDGLTKMVSERRIAAVLGEKIPLSDKLEKLKNIVLRRGGEDNTTILLFEVGKAARTPGRLLRNGLSFFRR